MNSDQQVSASAILQALTQQQRQGSRALAQLEQVEPELANYLMENLSLIHQKLLSLGGRPKATQRLYQDIQSLTLVCIGALRTSHYELWRQMMAGTRLASLDPTLSDAPRPRDTPKPDSDGPSP